LVVRKFGKKTFDLTVQAGYWKKLSVSEETVIRLVMRLVLPVQPRIRRVKPTFSETKNVKIIDQN
jgi:hypothetical protein